MIVYRLSKSVFSKDLSGKGAERAGGRWNSKGVAMVYSSSSKALCLAELAVHLPLGLIPKDYVMLSVNIPDDIGILEVSEIQLPKDWDAIPHSESTQKIGDEFVKKGQFLIFKAPSVVAKGDHNFLINPLHKDIHKLRIVRSEPFKFDPRLFL
jgi:RES domain-containing protein